MKFPVYLRHTTRTFRRGFTLMEMLIVLTIIALLMGMVIFQVTDLSGGAKRQKAQADLLGFKEMLASYQLDNGTLPTQEQGLAALWSRPTTDPVPQHWSKKLDEETLDPWGHHYQYRYPGKHNPDKYDIFSMGEDGLPDTADDIGNWPDAPSATTTTSN